MANSVVSNTGPLTHLTEINLLKSLDIFSDILIPEEVELELRRGKIIIPKKVKTVSIKPNWKDTVKILTNQRDLDLGESCAIALALQEKIEHFITDDLDARTVARDFHLEVHGSIGIILRAFRDRILDKKTAIEKVQELHTISSLFVTGDLIKQAILAIEEYSKRK